MDKERFDRIASAMQDEIVQWSMERQGKPIVKQLQHVESQFFFLKKMDQIKYTHAKLQQVGFTDAVI